MDNTWRAIIWSQFGAAIDMLENALVLLITPGLAVLYIIARSIDQGRLAGLVSVLSIEVGNFFHVLAATLGLSALLLSSALVFTVRILMPPSSSSLTNDTRKLTDKAKSLTVCASIGYRDTHYADDTLDRPLPILHLVK